MGVFTRTRALGFALPLLILSTAPVSAQWELLLEEPRPPAGPPRLDLTFGVGGSFSSDWSDHLILETRDPSGDRTTQLLMPEIRMAPGRTLAGGVSYWRGPLGVRLHAAVTRACLVAGQTRCDPAPDPETPVRFVTDLDAYAYGVQGLVGLVRGRVARVIRPYLLLGAGGVTLDPAEPVPGPDLPEEESESPGDGRTIIVVDGTTNLLLTLDRLGFETKFAAELGAGLDVRIPLGPHGLGLRLEVVDQLMHSPLGVRLVRLDGGIADGATAIDVGRPLIHTLRATVGVVLDIGLPAPPAEDIVAAHR